MTRILNGLLISLLLVVFSCGKTANIEVEKERIKAQIDLVSQAHLEKDAQLFYMPYAESWVEIRNGQIEEVDKKDQLEGTQAYLDVMEFQQLESGKDPVIEISDDGTLATYSNTVTVKGKLQGEPMLWIVAWQNVLRKMDGEWKIISNTNTEADPSVTAKTLLGHVRSGLGEGHSVENVYALADCTDPDGNAFKTLIMSRKEKGRMEQKSGPRHSILKHGANSWGYNVNSETLQDSLNTQMQIFAKSHELHWLSLWPETRYKNAKYEGIVDFKDQKAFKLNFVDDAEHPVNFYYRFDNYQPLAFDIEIDDQGNSVTTYFENWETVDGVSLFMNAVFDQGGQLFAYTFTDVQINFLKDIDFESKAAKIID